jgi:hypothetical protein
LIYFFFKNLQLVKSGTSETSKELLGLGVFNGLAFTFTVFVVGLEGLVRSGTSNGFVSERTLVFVSSGINFFVMLAK